MLTDEGGTFPVCAVAGAEAPRRSVHKSRDDGRFVTLLLGEEQLP